MRYWIMFTLLLVTIPAPALAGWYLLAPRQVTVEEAMRRNPHLQEDFEIAHATLSLREQLARWDHLESFDTAAECKQAQRQRYLAAIRPAPENLSPMPEGKPDFLQRLVQRLKARWKYIWDGRTKATESRFITPWDIINITIDAPDEIKKKHPKLEDYLRGLTITYSLCIASDDPRLLDQGSRQVETKNTASRASTRARVAPKQLDIRPVPGFPGLESAPLPR